MGKNNGPAVAAVTRAPPSPPSVPQNLTSLKTTNAIPLSTSLPTPSPSPEPASLKITAATTRPSPAPPSVKPRTKNKDSKSTATPSTTKLSSTPAIPSAKSHSKTTVHKLSLILNITLLALLLSVPLTFPAAISSARQVDIPAWQRLYASARSDPTGFAHEKYADAVSWITKLTQPGLSAQQEVWAREEAEAEARRMGLVDALSDVIKGATKKTKEDLGSDKAKTKDARSGVKYTKAKSGDKEWRREKPEPVEAGKDRTALSKTASASSSPSSKTTSASTASAAPSSPNTADEATTDNVAIPNNNTPNKADTLSKPSPSPSPPKDQPIGDAIADILAAFQQNKPKRASSGAERLLKDAADKTTTTTSKGKGSSLTKEQQDLADSVAGLIGFFGKVMTDTTSSSRSSDTAAKVPKDDTDTKDGGTVPDGDAGIDLETSSPADPIEALQPSEESDITALLTRKDAPEDTTTLEPISTNPDNNLIINKNNINSNADKPKSPTAPAAEAVGDILNLLGKLNSGALNKKEPSSPPSSAKSTQPNPAAAADLLGMLSQFAAAVPKKKTSRSSGSPGAGAGAGGLDLAGILGSLAAAGGNKQKPASTSAGGGGLDLVGILGALAGSTNNKQKGASSSSSSSASSGAGGELDLVNILSSFAAANRNTNNKNKNTRAGTAAGGTPLPPGIDINSAFKMLKMVNAFQGLSKTFTDIGNQAGDGDDTQTGGDSAQGKASGGADAMADMMGAGLEALSFFGKVMANMPQQQQSAVAKEVERVGLELDGAPAEQAPGST